MSRLIRLFVVAAVMLCGLGSLPSTAQAACLSPAGVAGEIIYNSSSNVLQYCDNTSWIGLGGNSQGYTMQPGWPDAIKCTESTTDYFLFPVARSDTTYWYRLIQSPTSTSDVLLSFSPGGAYISHTNLTGFDCVGQSITQLYAAAKAFNFVGGISGSSSDTLAGLACVSGQIPKWNGSAWACAADSAGGASQWSNVAGGINYAGGNVGIGTVTPQRPLHIKVSDSGSTTILALENDDVTNGSGTTISHRTTTTGTGASSFVEMGAIRMTAAEHDHPTRASGMSFWTTSAGTLAEQMVIDSSGRVGIGTSTVPVPAKLNVYGGYIQQGKASAAGNDIAYNWATLGGDQYMIGHANSKGWTMVARTDGWATVEQQNDMGLYYWDGTGFKTGLTVDSLTGNVGIGSIIGDPTVAGPKLQVTGAIVSVVNNAAAAATINFATSNVAYTSAACGAFTLQNMADGGSYSLIVKGSGAGPATFTHTALTTKTTGTLACASGKHTVFSFIRAGTDLYVTMITGY